MRLTTCKWTKLISFAISYFTHSHGTFPTESRSKMITISYLNEKVKASLSPPSARSDSVIYPSIRTISISLLGSYKMSHRSFKIIRLDGFLISLRFISMSIMKQSQKGWACNNVQILTSTGRRLKSLFGYYFSGFNIWVDQAETVWMTIIS